VAHHDGFDNVYYADSLKLIWLPIKTMKRNKPPRHHFYTAYYKSLYS